MNSPKRGRVYLVGAGPGDPTLITVRGRALLERADVVVYDALANPSLLEHCRADAQKIYVGKQAKTHSRTQDQINALLVELAQAGKQVVRLKGGDPFVFGRGGEECEALRSAGIEFEVVPGITAAVASAAYAGIPITHRDFNSSITLVTGHERQDEQSTGKMQVSLDYDALAKLPCIAFYMGVKTMPVICRKLIEHGMDASTPAAVIQRGTTAIQRTVVGTVQNIAQRAAEAQIGPPAVTIIGKVVTLRQSLNWFETRPLFGQTIVVTRTRRQASALSEKLAELGAHVIEAPTIEVAPPEDFADVDAALRAMGDYDWIIFTSVNGVEQTRQRLEHLGLDARAFGRAKIGAIGDATAQAIRSQLCLKVDLVPQSFVADALASELAKRDEIAGRKFMLLRAEIARPVLVEHLKRDGAGEVREATVYCTRRAKSLPKELLDELEAGRVSWITFTSSSTASNLAALLGEKYIETLRGVKLASIGPVTSATLRDLGLHPTVEAERYDIDGLVRAIVAAMGAG